jgi:23S rRNA (guanine2445-N2)-methyltransferase
MEAIKEYKTGMDFTAKTFAGMEDILASELIELGANDVEVIKRGCTFRGDEALMYKVNYLSRYAVRILKPIGVFEVKSSDQLYEKVKKIEWMEVFNLNQTFSVDANLFYSELDHSQYAALKTKDAIVDQFRDATGKRPWVSIENPNIYIDVHISHNICTISLDSSGESLHKRGYKIGSDKAPINEVLAAGMIKMSGWNGDRDFYDPMCGSGTIPMEAAMLAMNIPAGYYRKDFAFMNWDGHNEELWKSVKNEADENLIEHDCQIFASDRSEKAIGIAKRNLKHAGLHKDINIKVGYFDSIIPEKGGIIIMNPPYGIRLEERGELRDLYRGIGDVLKNNFTGFDAWIISPNFDSAKFIGLRPSKKVTLYNGPVETRYLKFEIYEGTKRYGDNSDTQTNKDGDNPDTGTKRNDDKDGTRGFKDRKREGGRFGSKSAKTERDTGSGSFEIRERKYDNNRDGTRDSGFKRKDYKTTDVNPDTENRRDLINKRSRDFDRHMESLRRFTKSDKKETEGNKSPRKRIRTRRKTDEDN